MGLLCCSLSLLNQWINLPLPVKNIRSYFFNQPFSFHSLILDSNYVSPFLVNSIISKILYFRSPTSFQLLLFIDGAVYTLSSKLLIRYSTTKLLIQLFFFCLLDLPQNSLPPYYYLNELFFSWDFSKFIDSLVNWLFQIIPHQLHCSSKAFSIHFYRLYMTEGWAFCHHSVMQLNSLVLSLFLMQHQIWGRAPVSRGSNASFFCNWIRAQKEKLQG